MLYIGDGKIVHAAGHDNGPSDKTKWNKSIRVEKLPSKQWERIKEVWRYEGSKDEPKKETKPVVKTLYVNGSDGELNIRKVEEQTQSLSQFLRMVLKLRLK